MNIKCKYSDIKAIYDWCDRYADEEAKELIGTQPSIYSLAYFTPAQANWSYQVGVVNYKGNTYEVITVFGEVRAVCPCNIPNYGNANEIRR